MRCRKLTLLKREDIFKSSSKIEKYKHESTALKICRMKRETVLMSDLQGKIKIKADATNCTLLSELLGQVYKFIK